MGYTEDLWTVMLSDDGTELAEALDRLATNEVASGIAAAELGLSQQCLNNEPETTMDADAE
ncbi:MAG: hypothetical protein F4117_01200 [Acidimicrobiales bacterium]|nr:hypothetical protein [Acidimicrobiales bacterium]MYA83019.1 hypothetical protein [Acidimicrobiales bacterium]MYB80609.1 hypothetical protein [Acidimicrobiales bacterium]MYH73500.1 hypothetical protein [Acidimicrobiales bacterium]MYI11168.1 hypothetical protein [Acidimicrobiales bacterium]